MIAYSIRAAAYCGFGYLSLALPAIIVLVLISIDPLRERMYLAPAR